MLTDNSLPNMMIQSKTNNHLSIINNHLAFCPLHLSRTLYKSTFLCKTNPILSAVGGLQMNVSIYLQMAYENKRNWTIGQSKPNSNPIKPNCLKAKMNVNSLITKDYERNDIFAVPESKPNSKPIQTQFSSGPT